MELHMIYEIKTQEVISSEDYISLSTQSLHVILQSSHREHMSAHTHTHMYTYIYWWTMWRIKLPNVLLFWNELDLDLHQGKVHVKMRQNQTNILIYQSISSGAQYVTVQKIISHPSLVMYFFATPPIKLKLGQQKVGDY